MQPAVHTLPYQHAHIVRLLSCFSAYQLQGTATGHPIPPYTASLQQRMRSKVPRRMGALGSCRKLLRPAHWPALGDPLRKGWLLRSQAKHSISSWQSSHSLEWLQQHPRMGDSIKLLARVANTWARQNG